MILFTRGDISDPYQVQVAATDGVRAGVLHTSKMTVERVALRADAFVTAGIEGACVLDTHASLLTILHAINIGVFSTTKDKKTAMKVGAREMLNNDFGEWHLLLLASKVD